MVEALGEFLDALRTVRSPFDIRAALACLEPILPSPPQLRMSEEDALFGAFQGTAEIGERIEVPISIDGSAVGTLAMDTACLAPGDLIRSERILLLTAALVGRELGDWRGRASIKKAPVASEGRARPAARRSPGKRTGQSGAFAMQPTGSALDAEISSDIANAALSDEPVLIRGEPGTEKVRVAAMIHHASARGNGPMIAVSTVGRNPKRLAEELFGLNPEGKGVLNKGVLNKGALNEGALNEEALGRIAHANAGTFFVDDVTDLSLEAQERLLRILSQRGPSSKKRGKGLDVRLIVATSQSLERLVESGAFRRDLYYAVTAASIRLRPLRQRKREIGELANQYLTQYAFRTGTRVPRISSQAMAVLAAYPWPHNVRELEQCLAQAAKNATDGVIYKRHLPAWVDPSVRKQAPSVSEVGFRGGPQIPGEDECTSDADGKE